MNKLTHTQMHRVLYDALYLSYIKESANAASVLTPIGKYSHKKKSYALWGLHC